MCAKVGSRRSPSSLVGWCGRECKREIKLRKEKESSVWFNSQCLELYTYIYMSLLRWHSSRNRIATVLIQAPTWHVIIMGWVCPLCFVGCCSPSDDKAKVVTRLKLVYSIKMTGGTC